MNYTAIAQQLTFIHLLVIPYLVKTYLWPEKIDNIPLFLFILLFSVHELAYTIFNLILYFIYKSDNPFFEQFKVNNEKWPWKENPEEFRVLFKRSMKQIIINQFVVLPLILFTNSVILKKLKLRVDLESFPETYEIIWQTLFFTICDDFLFYWSHRFLHWNRIYPYIHKIHHEYKITLGIASEYAHPVEFIFGNILPTSLGSMLLGTKVHAFTYAIWICEKIYKTTEAHSGYGFPWSPTTLMPFKVPSDHHNFHHLKFKGNYGGHFNFWDWICGTNNADYLKSLEKKKKTD